MEVQNLSIYEFCDIAIDNGSDLYFNQPDGKIYYVPVDKDKYEHIFRRSTPKMLAALPNRKKLDILMAIHQDSYTSISAEDKHNEKLNKHIDKLQALLQLKISPQFWAAEQRKIRLIIADIANIAYIKHKLDNFQEMPLKNQKKLLKDVSAITARYNCINKPNIMFVSQKQIEADKGLSQWMETEAYTYENNILINMDIVKSLSGLQAISSAWHETNHVAQAYADYKQFPEAESLFNQRLNFLQQMPETYIFHPQELVTYALERLFIEECNSRIKLLLDERNYSYQSEYDISSHYMQRAILNKGREKF